MQYLYIQGRENIRSSKVDKFEKHSSKLSTRLLHSERRGNETKIFVYETFRANQRVNGLFVCPTFTKDFSLTAPQKFPSRPTQSRGRLPITRLLSLSSSMIIKLISSLGIDGVPCDALVNTTGVSSVNYEINSTSLGIAKKIISIRLFS